MPETSQAIKQLESPQRPSALVHAAAYLVFEGMRLDPTNPAWLRGDALFFAEAYAEVVHAALRNAGCSQEALPEAGYRSLDDALAQGRAVFALADAEGATRLARLRDLNASITVISPDSPTDSHRWDVRIQENLRVEDLRALAPSGVRREKPLWIVAPLGGARIMEAKGRSSLPALANRMKVLGTETAFDVLAQVNALRAQGRDILSFGLGEPDFDTPGHIREAAKKALDNGMTHYGPSAGLPELRQSIARYIQRTRGIPCDESEIVVTPGAKPVMFDAMMALINPGDEVIYPNPGYPIYESVIDWIGGVSVPLPLLEEKDWNFEIDDLARLMTPRTKAIVLNSPGNPCGNTLTKELLRDVAQLAVDRNLWIISDEVYSQIVFGDEHHSVASFPGMKERTVVVDGFSKTYAMTGWRLGYGVMNADLAKQVAKIDRKSVV